MMLELISHGINKTLCIFKNSQDTKGVLKFHSMSDHPKKIKFETAPSQILIKLYTLPLCDNSRRPVIFLALFEK